MITQNHCCAPCSLPVVHQRRAMFALLSLLCLAVAPTATFGSGKYLKIDYPASTAPDELQVAVTYTLWLPEGATRLRGVIVHQHGAGTTASKEGSTAAYDLHWQALAKKWDCALLGPSFHVSNEKVDLTPGGSELWFDSRHGSEKTFLRALSEFAATSGHPELERVPWVLWGHSGGGIWSDVMSTLHPDRVLAMWLRSGTAAMFRTHPEFPQPEVPATVYAIPTMTNPGVKEKGPYQGNLATFQEYRAKGAPIGFAPDPRTGHECGDSRYLAIPYLDACLAMRLPDKGADTAKLKPIDQSHVWLADLATLEATPAADFKGDPNSAVWLPSEAVAKAWVEYAKTGAVGDTTPPPSPFQIQAIARGDQGAEITWDAEADFESGIRQFIVLRDGQELAKVPENPVGKFGRPLFQSMTYHDTPDQPLPEMRYIDTSAKADAQHTYTVVAVNSVGLQSAPSAEARLGTDAGPTASSTTAPFEGEKTSWHDGFDRYDFVMNEETFVITPYKRDTAEGFGVRPPAAGQRRCIVVAPKTPAPGGPWSWQGCYWDHQPQGEVELLRRGFYIAFITPEPDQRWDAWYKWLTEQHGFSKKPAFIGMSKGAYNAYTWGTANPDKVSCIYGDNAGASPELLMKLGALAKYDVPILSINGSIDPLLGRYGLAIENIYQQLGGRISMMIKDGYAHHPHSLRDPKIIADFIEQNAHPESAPSPDFLGRNPLRTSFYSDESAYRDFPKEGTSITCRGPIFTPCYDKYAFDLPGVKGTITVVAPKTSAAGKPWVYRSDFLSRSAAVDLALLAKGFHIVTGPVPYDADGPSLAHWNTAYQHFVSHGFSPKPVLEGDGRATGEVYAWAIENPDKVSCIYGENPVLRATITKTPILDNLSVLAKAGVPLIHVCGSADPALEENTRAAQKRYTEAGGQITVIVKDGDGHYPLAPKDPTSVVDLIVQAAAK